MSIGKEIKRYLEDRGIKQTFLADQINLHPGSLNRTLQGKRSLKADEFIAICTVLNKTPDYFTDTHSKEKHE